jgi:hypothetical protein
MAEREITLDTFKQYISSTADLRDRFVLEDLMARSFPVTGHLWKPAHCHNAAEAVLQHFQVNHEDVPPATEIIQVSTNVNHSWIEIQINEDANIDLPRRGNLIFDPTGTRPEGSLIRTPYFGPVEDAPPHLLDDYRGADAYRTVTLDGQIEKTKEVYFFPWDNFEEWRDNHK